MLGNSFSAMPFAAPLQPLVAITRVAYGSRGSNLKFLKIRDV
jgi:hypothetical protein